MTTDTSMNPTEDLANRREEAKKQERKARARLANPDTPSPQEGATVDDEDPPGF